MERHQPSASRSMLTDPNATTTARAYEVEVGQDLLFEWVVPVHSDRATRPGHQLTDAVADPDAARAFVRGRPKRRLPAPERSGCGYRLTHAVRAKGKKPADRMPDGLLP